MGTRITKKHRTYRKQKNKNLHKGNYINNIIKTRRSKYMLSIGDTT